MSLATRLQHVAELLNNRFQGTHVIGSHIGEEVKVLEQLSVIHTLSFSWCRAHAAGHRRMASRLGMSLAITNWYKRGVARTHVLVCSATTASGPTQPRLLILRVHCTTPFSRAIVVYAAIHGVYDKGKHLTIVFSCLK
jgi:hypothetical protein